MSKTYFIRGTISVEVGGDKSTLWVTPCAGFLTPDKKKAIAFPNSSNTSTTAKLIDLADGKTFECEAGEIAHHLPALISLAAQSKPIELSLNVPKPKESKVAGFIFPVPSDHAHGC